MTRKVCTQRVQTFLRGFIWMSQKLDASMYKAVIFLFIKQETGVMWPFIPRGLCEVFYLIITEWLLSVEQSQTQTCMH